MLCTYVYVDSDTSIHEMFIKALQRSLLSRVWDEGGGWRWGVESWYGVEGAVGEGVGR